MIIFIKFSVSCIATIQIGVTLYYQQTMICIYNAYREIKSGGVYRWQSFGNFILKHFYQNWHLLDLNLEASENLLTKHHYCLWLLFNLYFTSTSNLLIIILHILIYLCLTVIK